MSACILVSMPEEVRREILMRVHFREPPASASQYEQDIAFSQLLSEVDRGNVRDVVIQGPDIHGTFTNQKTITLQEVEAPRKSSPQTLHHQEIGAAKRDNLIKEKEALLGLPPYPGDQPGLT